MRMRDILSKEQMNSFKLFLTKLSEKSEEEQAAFKEKVLDEIEKLGTKESILYKNK